MSKPGPLRLAHCHRRQSLSLEKLWATKREAGLGEKLKFMHVRPPELALSVPKPLGLAGMTSACRSGSDHLGPAVDAELEVKLFPCSKLMQAALSSHSKVSGVGDLFDVQFVDVLQLFQGGYPLIALHTPDSFQLG